MTAASASQRGASNRRKGAAAELAVARWLRTVGFGGAERAVRTGYRTATRVSPDPGDLTGTPGIVWSVKDCAVDRLPQWQAELDAMLDWLDASGDQIGLLVHKRRGHADPAVWWCWLTLSDLALLTHGHYAGPEWVRMRLGDVVPLLRAAGYGDPVQVA